MATRILFISLSETLVVLVELSEEEESMIGMYPETEEESFDFFLEEEIFFLNALVWAAILDDDDGAYFILSTQKLLFYNVEILTLHRSSQLSIFLHRKQQH